jgi:hypothetical protein
MIVVGGLPPGRRKAERVNASPASTTYAKRGVHGNAAPGLAPLENVSAGLDWQSFSAAYFPGSGRHDLKAIVAYGAYRSSVVARDPPASEAARLKADAITTQARSVEEWEDEGGALQ